MARAATETQQAGLTGLEFGLAIPGTVGGAVWANAGAHETDVAGGPRDRPGVLAADGTETRRRRRPSSALALPRQPVQGADARRGRAADLVLDATFRLSSRRPRRRSRRASTRSAAGARPTSRSGCRRPGASSATRTGDSAGRLIEAAGLKGRRIGGAVVSEKHANFIVNDQKGTAADVRRLAEHVRAEVARRATASSSRSRSSSSATGRLARPPHDRRPPRPPAGRRPARRPVGRARRLDRVRDGHRRGPRPTAGIAVEQVLIDLDGGWWWLPADHRRDDRRRAAYDDPAALGADGPAHGRRGHRPARRRATRHRSSSSPSTARSARTARSRRCSRRPGSPTRAPASPPRRSGWTRRSSSGSCRGHRPAGRRLARGPRRALGDATRRRSARELEAFAAGTRRPAADGQARRASGSSVGMTLVHDPAELRRRARRRRSATTRSPSSRRTSPGARDLEVAVIGNDPAALELYGPGEIVAGHEFYDYAAKYTPGLSETSTRAEVSDRERAIDAARSPATRTGRSGPRASRGSTSWSPATTIFLSEINTIPGFTPISLFPTMPAEGGYTFADVCRRVVDLALERHAGARRPAADARRTCRDERRGPAAAGGPGRRAAARHARTRSVRRASAGLSRSGPAPRWRCSRRRPRSTASAPSSAFGYAHLEVDGAHVHRPGRGRGGARRRRGREPVRARRPGRSRRACETLPTVARRRGRRRAARTRSRSRIEERAADPRLAGRGAALPRRRDGALFARLGDEPPRRARPTCPVVDDRRAASAGLSVGAPLDPVDLDAATRLASLRPGRRRQRGRARWRSA